MYDFGPQVIAKNSDWFIVLFAPVGRSSYGVGQSFDQLFANN